MIDKNLATGFFPKIKVTALVIMMVRDEMLENAPSTSVHKIGRLCGLNSIGAQTTGVFLD